MATSQHEKELSELRNLRHVKQNYLSYIRITQERQAEWVAQATDVLATDDRIHAACQAHPLCRLINALALAGRAERLLDAEDDLLYVLADNG